MFVNWDFVDAAIHFLKSRLTKASFPAMSTITVTLPDDDLAFLRWFSKTQGTSPEEILARQAHNLRRQLERPLPPVTFAASGIIAANVDASKEHSDHLERKHL